MTGILIQDGRRTGHLSWASDIIAAGGASGIIVSPFMTPRFRIPRYTSGADNARRVREAGGEVIFDPMTHARLLIGANRTDLYDTWELWGGSGPDLESLVARQQHIERVFERQDELGAPRLAPTLALESPAAATATTAQAIRAAARGIDPTCWQSVAGTRLFWRGGALLDAYVGELADLRAPTWVVTVTNEMVLDQAPDYSDTAAFEGLLRSVHSLSERSRVIVSFADFSGLPSVAAGADTVGAGWDRGMRTFDPQSFHINSDPGIRIPASYVTQRGLTAVLRRDAAAAIERWEPAEAARIRGGPMPTNERQERLHHLRSLTDLITSIDGQSTRADRVLALRQIYESATRDFELLISALRPTVRPIDLETWVSRQMAALRSYALSEGLW